jgi:hypothetical protein
VSQATVSLWLCVKTINQKPQFSAFGYWLRFLLKLGEYIFGLKDSLSRLNGYVGPIAKESTLAKTIYLEKPKQLKIFRID